MNIPGENLPSVYSANEFLTRINLMKAYDFPNYETPVKKAEKVVVVGGGNVAMDSARCAKRLGSSVTLVYRRSLEEMPARIEEIQNAREEGIELLFLTNPTKIIGADKVEGIECVQMQLGEIDADGRRAPVPIENSEFVIPCQQVIIAIGQGPNPLLVKQTNLNKDFKGYLNVNEKGQTSDPKIFAGGDIVKGAATVIKAMADGKKAAKAIDESLNKK
jgi:glutamate synthase (NADPH/NADH) small chain